MRVAIDSNGVVTSSGDDLPEPYISFPLNWAAADLMGLHVITGLTGLRLLITDNQVVAREDNSRNQLGSTPVTTEQVALAVSAWMAAHPDLKGSQGQAGPQGPQGVAGPQGVPGPSGNTGAAGADGPRGATGLTGSAGAKGDPGAAGTTGATGLQGDQGPAGSPGANVSTVRTSVPVSLTLVLGIPQDVTFSWSSAFAGTNYSYDVALAPALLGKVSVAIKTKTAAALTVTVTATTLVAAGSGIAAVAWA